MRVAIGCDPNASDLKLEITAELEELGIETVDLGSDDPIYANVAVEVGEAVAAGTFDRGIVLCGTGIGVSIAANKVPGAYCALVTNIYQAERAVLSNNANIIAMGAQVTTSTLARLFARTFVTSVYVPGGRSEPKIRRIAEYDDNRSR
jgi:ribose 5-phosphate isomerase B